MALIFTFLHPTLCAKSLLLVLINLMSPGPYPNPKALRPWKAPTAKT